MPLSLEDQLLIRQGDKTIQDDFITGRSMEIWICPLRTKQNVPEVITLTCSATASGATSISLLASKEVILYRNQALKLVSGTTVLTTDYVVVKSTTTVGTSATAVPVYPIDSAITSGQTARIYPMTPLFSAKEGGIPDSSSSFAEAHNKNMGYYSVSQKIKEENNTSIAGDLNFADPALAIIRQIHTAGLVRLFVQVRHSVTTVIGSEQYSEGPFAIEYRGVPTVKINDPEGGMVGFSMEVKVSGQLDDYKLL